MSRISRILVVLAGVMGAGGVILAALSSHGGDAALLGPASSMLLVHASAVLGTVALAERCLIQPKGRPRRRARLCRGNPAVRRRSDDAPRYRAPPVSARGPDRRHV